MRPFVAALLVLVMVTARAPSATAAWPNSPYVSLAVCTATSNQYDPQVVSDGAGGAIIVWYDSRSGNHDIYAQHVLASGAVDPAWPANGPALCTLAGSQNTPQLVSDGAGGAIVTWQDARSGNYDICAQHVLASGAVDPAWPADGRALCVATAEQSLPQLVSDGAGGAIVTWRDYRSGSSFDIYAQRILASGVADPAWPANGHALCTATNHQDRPRIVSDGAGGAIVTWEDYRPGTATDIYAQRVLATGSVDPAWPADGRAVCTASDNQYFPQIVSDGAGGAIVTWYDYRNGGVTDIYAQHVLTSGAADPTWSSNGIVLCAATGSQSRARIAADGAGGAIVTWHDGRGGAGEDIYALHVLASGVADPAWPVNGRALCTAVSSQTEPQIVSDGAAGAIVTWHDYRGGSYYDVYAQHVLASGAVDPSWPADGRAVSLAPSEQYAPQIVPDGMGGAIVTWQDYRSGSNDIYAQRVARYGYLGTPEPEIVSVADVPNDQGGRVKLSWNASYLEGDPYALVTYYRVFRSVPPNVAASLLRMDKPVADASGAEDGFEVPGTVLVTQAAGATYYWEYVGNVDADYLGGYSYHAPTAEDSMAAGAPPTAFMVQARTAGSQHWESLPLSGYSVDDLAPAQPVPFTGQYAAGTIFLHWNRNTEADLAGYRLYRGTSAGFVPGPGNLVAVLADTGYADPAGAPHFYKLTAGDVHGNESPVAILSPEGTVDVGGPVVVRELSFAPPTPNPAGAAATLRYGLPRAARVRLSVYDAAGRLVRQVAAGTREAGEHAERWDLRDAAGRPVGAGLYFARLEVEGRALARRIAVSR